MKTLLVLFLVTIFSFANEKILNAKNCEKFQLSKYTLLISCHKLDYLVEYKYNDDVEKDDIKKITVITSQEEKILLKNVGN
jgi:hypothetical protein